MTVSKLVSRNQKRMRQSETGERSGSLALFLPVLLSFLYSYIFLLSSPSFSASNTVNAIQLEVR